MVTPAAPAVANGVVFALATGEWVRQANDREGGLYQAETRIQKSSPAVLYALDGQALWTTSSDPFGVWGLDLVIDRLNELDAIEELIVVGIHTSERRAERLSPVPDLSLIHI